MAPKKAAAAAPAKKTATAPSHPSYKDMIKEAILTLKERNGSSRQAMKKYIMANHKNLSATPAQFDQQFNKALRTGVEKGDFTQPKGSSGPVKLAKKEAAPKKTTSEPAAKKTSEAKPKKAAAPKKTTAAAKPKTATKKASTTTKKAAAPKANTSTKRKTKVVPETAPAVVDVPKVLSKTKSGRVTKTPAKAASKPPAKKAAGTKKAAPKKAAPKKAAAPGPATAAPAAT